VPGIHVGDNVAASQLAVTPIRPVIKDRLLIVRIAEIGGMTELVGKALLDKPVDRALPGFWLPLRAARRMCLVTR
jgi:hypothetical protein